MQESKRLLGQIRNEAGVASRDFGKLGGGVNVLSAGFRTLQSSLGSLGIAATGAGLVAIGQSAVTSATELQRTADAAGIGAEALQVYQLAGKDVGAGADQVSDALVEFNLRLGEAQQAGTGTLASEAKRLGINLRDARGEIRSAADVLDDFADAIAESDESQRRFVADEIFGGEGARIAGIFEEGSQGIRDFETELRASNALVDGETIATLTRWGEMLEEVGEKAAAASKRATAAVLGFADRVGATLGFGEAAVQIAITEERIEALRLEIEELRKLPEDPIARFFGRDTNRELTQALRRLEEFEEKLRSLRAPTIGDEMRAQLVALGIVIDDDVKPAFERLNEETEKALEAAAKRLEGGRDATQVYRDAVNQLGEDLELLAEKQKGGVSADQYDQARGLLEKYTAALEDAIEAEGDQADAAFAALLASDEWKDGIQQLSSAQAEANRLLEATRTPLEEYEERIRRIRELESTPGVFLPAEVASRAESQAFEEMERKLAELEGRAPGVARAFEKIGESAGSAADLADDGFSTAAESLSSGVAAAALDAEFSIEGLAQSVAREVSFMIGRWLALQAIVGLGNFALSLFGGGSTPTPTPTPGTTVLQGGVGFQQTAAGGVLEGDGELLAAGGVVDPRARDLLERPGPTAILPVSGTTAVAAESGPGGPRTLELVRSPVSGDLVVALPRDASVEMDAATFERASREPGRGPARSLAEIRPISLAAAASGAVIQSPVVFDTAEGLGIAGEAGPEAILPATPIPGGFAVAGERLTPEGGRSRELVPLTRTAGGELGVDLRDLLEPVTTTPRAFASGGIVGSAAPVSVVRYAAGGGRGEPLGRALDLAGGINTSVSISIEGGAEAMQAGQDPRFRERLADQLGKGIEQTAREIVRDEIRKQKRVGGSLRPRLEA